jgi:hypothetical protein
MTLLRITSPYFVAGVIVGVRAAPIIRYMAGWPMAKIYDYCRRKAGDQFRIAIQGRSREQMSVSFEVLRIDGRTVTIRVQSPDWVRRAQ